MQSCFVRRAVEDKKLWCCFFKFVLLSPYINVHQFYFPVICKDGQDLLIFGDTDF